MPRPEKIFDPESELDCVFKEFADFMGYTVQYTGSSWLHDAIELKDPASLEVCCDVASAFYDKLMHVRECISEEFQDDWFPSARRTVGAASAA